MKAMIAIAVAWILGAAGAVAVDAPDVSTFINLRETIRADAPQGHKAPLRERVGLYIAMFSAANTVEPRYAAYLEGLPAASGDPNAAAALAGVRYLRAVYPYADEKMLGEIERAALKSAPRKDRDALAALADAAVAAAIARVEKTTGEVPDWIPIAIPGRYVPTTIPVTNSPWQVLKPFALARQDALRPEGPPALDSEQYARDLNEVKAIGARKSETRNDEQTAEALFWIGLSATDWAPALLARRDLDLFDEARIMMLIEMANADGWSATVDTKMHFDFWRPITAIRLADQDGRADTVADTSWSPLLTTPNHSEYLSGHCQYSATMGQVFARLLPLLEGETVTVPEQTLSDRSRRDLIAAGHEPSLIDGMSAELDDYDDYVRRACDARIYAGLHYRTTNDHSIAVRPAAAHPLIDTIATPNPP